MSYSQYQNTTWSSPLDIPLGAYNNLPYEDFDNQSQPCQTAPYPPLKRSRLQSESTSPTSPDQAHLNPNTSSSSVYPISHIPSSLPSLTWTPESSSPDLFPIPSVDSSLKRTVSPFSIPLCIEDDDSLFANITLLPLDPESLNVATNPQVPSPEPVVGHRAVSPFSKKRSHANSEYDCPDNASENAFSNRKRRKLSIDTSPQNRPQCKAGALTNVIDFHPSTRHLTSNVSPTYLHSTINDIHSSKITSDTPDNFNVSIENDTAFIANIDPTLLEYKFLHEAATHLTPQAPEPVVHLPSPSKKRLHTDDVINDGRVPSNPYPKRRKISSDDYHLTSSVTTPLYTNDIMTDIKENKYVPVSPHTPRIKLCPAPHTSNASMRRSMPPTSGTSSAEPAKPALRFEIYDPRSPSSPIPALKTTQGSPRRRGRQATPASYLWRKEIDKNCTIYRCLYKGPAMPDGCMQGFRKSLRNLGRHMRLHAGLEDKMDISEVEKIALNGLPDALRKQRAVCSLHDKDLLLCAYYRKHGVRWSTMTWGRPEIVSGKHGASDHPVNLQQKKRGKIKAAGS